MFLKSIEMQGFKSFADKTKIVFDKGVTAVVGPNGSGKSNITESLRWALGESSAKSLRGGKMPDIIFAGTENRKPLNYAEVKVTLDNQDHFMPDANDEVVVERHIYRNGDSDYLIDGKKVRLRDIHDLFMDTGLGRDSFSIISQGRVETIFNSKPEERRAIFEEAAGVLKYKTRKKETESKLDQTQGNLDRVEDIIYELDRQIEPLKKQASTAQSFLEMDKERSTLQLDLLVHDIHHYRADLDVKTQDLEAIKKTVQKGHTERQKLEDSRQSLKAKRHRVLQEREDKNAALLSLTHLISDTKSKIDLSILEKTQSEKSKQEKEEQVERLKERIRLLSLEKDDKLEQQRTVANRLNDLRAKEEALLKEQKQFAEDPEQAVEQVREQYLAVMQEEADLSNELLNLDNHISNLQKEESSQNQEYQDLTAKIKQEEAHYALAQKTYKEAADTVQSVLKAYQNTKESLNQARLSYQKKQGQMFELMDRLKNQKARVASLEAILKNHSHFYHGVRSILQEKEQLPGIIGAVSDNISFKNTFQTAMEIALGAASQHVIVQDEKTATQAIQFLKQSRSGRATFLPLTTIKPRYIADPVLEKLVHSDGFLGRASDLADYDKRLQSIFENLLGSIAIFETIEEAKKAARKVGFRVRMVTLDGSEIRPGGSYAGGSSKTKNTTFIKPELDDLMAKVSQTQEELTAIETIVKDEKATIDAKEKELENYQEAGEQARLKEQEAHFQYQNLEQSLEEMKKLLDSYHKQQTVSVLSQLMQEKTELSEQAEKLSHQKDSLTNRIAALKENQDSFKEQSKTIQEALSQLHLTVTSLKGEQGFIETDVNRLTEEITSLSDEEKRLSEWLLGKADASQVDIDQLHTQLHEAESKKEATDTRLIQLKFELDDIDSQLDDIGEKLNQMMSQNEDLIRRQTKVENTVSSLEGRLHTLATTLSTDYSLSFAQARQKAREIDDIIASRERITNLEQAIKRLGPINLEAIDQFEEVNGRLTFLNQQKEDLVKAKDLLQTTIDSMNDEVVNRFKMTFEAIRESFKTTFTQMFGGGQADLLLTSEDWLTAGVDISVQPPGKKIQSLKLMSGGEKALSALALLFAIIRVKTIPFVILDEVEAALDEANVNRFGNYLNRFDQSSQFIVVTHRKGTMEAADAIYGVTMQESGVSKIVSVKLTDLKEETVN